MSASLAIFMAKTELQKCKSYIHNKNKNPATQTCVYHKVE